uniref:IMS_C domain-containing protein n=1 Tax=Heterorhabditis bacteriophora TaxID=37862 RepID=A0A1I7X429_HETBA
MRFTPWDPRNKSINSLLFPWELLSIKTRTGAMHNRRCTRTLIDGNSLNQLIELERHGAEDSFVLGQVLSTLNQELSSSTFLVHINARLAMVVETPVIRTENFRYFPAKGKQPKKLLKMESTLDVTSRLLEESPQRKISNLSAGSSEHFMSRKRSIRERMREVEAKRSIIAKKPSPPSIFEAAAIIGKFSGQRIDLLSDLIT